MNDTAGLLNWHQQGLVSSGSALRLFGIPLGDGRPGRSGAAQSNSGVKWLARNFITNLQTLDCGYSSHHHPHSIARFVPVTQPLVSMLKNTTVFWIPAVLFAVQAL